MTSEKIKAALKNFGLPRLIIAGFLLLLLIMAPFVGADLPTQISNIINRFSWNGILVLAMVPMVHSGCGLNFGLPLGIISGLLGATLSIELGFTGPLAFRAGPRRAVRMAPQQDQGRRDDDRDLRRILLCIFDVYDVADPSLPQPQHGLGSFR